MRTKNFRKFLAAITSWGVLKNWNYSSYETMYCNIVDITGTQKQVQVSSGCEGKMVVGTGTTPPTEDDYKIENKANLTSIKQIPLWTDDSTNMIVVATFKNNTAEAITITEVAYQLKWDDSFIISRDLITPITIPAGETRTIQYTIEF